MPTALLPVALSLAVLAELDPTTRRPDRIHAVMAWRDDGEVIYQPLTAPSAAPATASQPSLDFALPPLPAQLPLDLGDLGTTRSSSCGLTWRTWALPTIPPPLRHLPPAGVVRELVRRFGG